MATTSFGRAVGALRCLKRFVNNTVYCDGLDIYMYMYMCMYIYIHIKSKLLAF